MSVHLMPGPLTGVGPPGKAAAAIATGPPGLAAMFAALLFQQGSSTLQRPTLPVKTETAKAETEKSTPNYSRQRKAAKIKQATPLKLEVAIAKIKNAMDTPPASLPSPGKSANPKPDGELPPSETRTFVSIGSSVLPPSHPTTFISALPAQTVPVPASLVPASHELSAPVLRSSVEAAKAVTGLAPAKLAVIAGLAPAKPAVVPALTADISTLVATAIPLPKTFGILPRQAIEKAYIAEVNANGVSSPVLPAPQPLIGASRYDEIGSAVAASSPATASQLAIGTRSLETEALPVSRAASMLPDKLGSSPPLRLPPLRLPAQNQSTRSQTIPAHDMLTLSNSAFPVVPAVRPSAQNASFPELRATPVLLSPTPSNQAMLKLEEVATKNLTNSPLLNEALPVLRAADHAPVTVRQEASHVKGTTLPGKTRLVAGEKRAGGSSPLIGSHSANSEQASTGSLVLPAEEAVPEDAGSRPPNSVQAPVHPPQTPAAETVAGAAPIAPPVEKSLKTGAVSADTQAINNTRVFTAPVWQSLPTQGAEAVAGKPEEKAPERNALILLPNATPAAPIASDRPTVVLPLSQTERAQIVKQVAEGVGAMRQPSRPATPEQMTIQLHPKDWGKLQVSVVLAAPAPTAPAGQKAVIAHVVAESHQVKAALESQTGELRHALQAAGLHLERLTVSVQRASHSEPALAASGSQPQANLGGGSGNGQPGGSAFASFAGNSHSGRQEQSPGYPTVVGSIEPEDLAEPLTLRQMMRGQVDTRA